MNTLNPPCPLWADQVANQTRYTFTISGRVRVHIGRNSVVRNSVRGQGWVWG